MVSAPPVCCGPPRVSGILYATSAESGSSSSSNSSSISSASCVNVLRLNDGCVASSNIRIGVARLKCSARSNSGGFDTQFSSFWVEGTTSGPAGSGVGGLSGAAAALEASSVAIHTNGGYGSRGGAAAEVVACSSSGETTVVPVTQLSEEEVENAREWAHKPRRIALFVEPSPFAYVSQLPFPLLLTKWIPFATLQQNSNLLQLHSKQLMFRTHVEKL
jgi:hypothetical protein